MTASISSPDDPDVEGPEPAASPGPGPSRLRRIRTSNLDLRNTWQIVVGSLLLPLGIAFILLAWSGAAHGRVDQQQIPYLVSGGIGGLAVVMIGCFFYWAHWLYRIYDQADLHHEEALREQREMMRALIDALVTSGPRGALGGEPEAEEALAGRGSVSPARRDSPTIGVPVNGRLRRRTFVATPTGSNFHTPGCPMVANRGGNLRTITEHEADQLKPCRVCEPLVSTN